MLAYVKIMFVYNNCVNTSLFKDKQLQGALIMVEALTLEKLNKKIEKRYAYDEKRVVGIMMARYDLNLTKAIVEQNYQYWHRNTRKYIDVFWAGYGAYLPPNDETSTKTILNFSGNTQRVYFDLDAFIDIKEEINKHYKKPYEDKLQLILLNYRDGKLWFEESMIIDLEENLDANYAKIRKIMEFVTRECRREHEVAPIYKKLTLANFIEYIKGISISDVMNAVIGITGVMDYSD